jgi:hypothetical protein
MATKRKQFAVCIRNTGYEVSLERRKIYELLPDAEAKKAKHVRVVDESGEDYLYPEAFFAPIDLSQSLRRALRAGA